MSLAVRPLRGGLTSRSVHEVSARYLDEFGKRRLFRFVVKHLEGVSREALIYEGLLRTSLREIIPSVLGVVRVNGEPTHLYLEAFAQDIRWPWTNVDLVTRVLERLAHVHAPELVGNLEPRIAGWDYDAELNRTAAITLDLAERTKHDFEAVARTLPAMRRLTKNLRPIRREILNLSLLPPTVLHGDLHPGNVIVRWHAGRNEPMLIDWARARRGSPLEDVSSWLQSLGCWEPMVQRKHDSLLSAYLSARGLSRRISKELREVYWLAGALNCFAGSTHYYLEAAGSRTVGPRARRVAQQALRHYLRVIQRADAGWRG